MFSSHREDLQCEIQEEGKDNHQGGTKHRAERDLHLWCLACLMKVKLVFLTFKF